MQRAIEGRSTRPGDRPDRNSGLGGIPGGGDPVAQPVGGDVAIKEPLSTPAPQAPSPEPKVPNMPAPPTPLLPAPSSPLPPAPAPPQVPPPTVVPPQPQPGGVHPVLGLGVAETAPSTFARPGSPGYAPFQGRAFGRDIRTGGGTAAEVLAALSQGTGANVGAVGRAPTGPGAGAGTAGEALGGLGTGLEDDALIRAALKAQGLA